MFSAIFADAASINLPSNEAAPWPAFAASSKAIKILFALSTSAGGGVNTSFASSICEG